MPRTIQPDHPIRIILGDTVHMLRRHRRRRHRSIVIIIDAAIVTPRRFCIDRAMVATKIIAWALIV